MENALTLGLFLFATLMVNIKVDTYSLTAKVIDLNNSKGTVIFSLYNKDGTIPDEKFKKYYKTKTVSIIDKKAEVTFTNLPQGFYAVTVLHDENNNKKIDKKFMLPLPEEGVGFSNYDDFGLSNRPNFKNANFKLIKDATITVKVIYK